MMTIELFLELCECFPTIPYCNTTIAVATKAASDGIALLILLADRTAQGHTCELLKPLLAILTKGVIPLLPSCVAQVVTPWRRARSPFALCRHTCLLIMAGRDLGLRL